MIIAVDGPAASGKGTIAAALATHYRVPHLDTGLLYRAVGQAMAGVLDGDDFVERAISAATQLDPSDLDPALLGTPEVALAAAKIARIDGVRAALRDFQHTFATQPGGAILDGRDIGSRICPDADAKLFIVATADVRADRRWRQLTAKGVTVSRADILAQIVQRDESDRTNPAGAFYQTDDAHLLDTTDLAIEPAIRAAIAIVDAAMIGGGE